MFLIELSHRRLELAAGLVGPDEAIAAEATNTVAAVRDLTGEARGRRHRRRRRLGGAQEDAVVAARQGTVGFFGGLPKDRPTITLDSNIVHYREVGIVGANGSTPAHNQQALELIASGAVPVADLITHRLPLEDTIEGIHTVARGEDHQGDRRADRLTPVGVWIVGQRPTPCR